MARNMSTAINRVSWFIREKNTKRVVFETFSSSVAESVNTQEYEVMTNNKPEPDSAEWWKEVAQGLAIKLFDANRVGAPSMHWLKTKIDQAKEHPWTVNADYWDGRASAFEEVRSVLTNQKGRSQ